MLAPYYRVAQERAVDDARRIERAVIVAESDAVCDGCGADPRTHAGTLNGWFINAVRTPDAVVAMVLCPACW